MKTKLVLSMAGLIVSAALPLVAHHSFNAEYDASKPVTLKVPAGTRSGRVFRVAGQGVPMAPKPGDLLVTFEVDVPPKLSADERRAVEALAKASADEGSKLREKLGAVTE